MKKWITPSRSYSQNFPKIDIYSSCTIDWSKGELLRSRSSGKRERRRETRPVSYRVVNWQLGLVSSRNISAWFRRVASAGRRILSIRGRTKPRTGARQKGRGGRGIKTKEIVEREEPVKKKKEREARLLFDALTSGRYLLDWWLFLKVCSIDKCIIYFIN